MLCQVNLDVQPHERALVRAFLCEFDEAIGGLPSPSLELNPQVDPALRSAVRGVLKWGGFKPSGRSKPASEYLEQARTEGALQPINPVVDMGNLISLLTGFPVSVLDGALARAPYRLAVVADKVRYVFNPSGQELDLKGLLCWWDAAGPCGSPVKDSQRTKTRAETRQTLCVLWGCAEFPQQVEAAYQLYLEKVSDWPCRVSPLL